MTVVYFGIEACKKYGFPYIYKELTESEEAPDYESEANGIAELQKVLSFVQNDSYYPVFEDKCAYLICSIAGSQYFSNGNKRLSITILMMFLENNHTSVLGNLEGLKSILAEAFPKHTWEENVHIIKAHSLFLYNLAIVLGDRTKWETSDFSEIRGLVAKIFTIVHERFI